MTYVLPKAELHVHLEGTLEADLMFSLAVRNGIELPWPEVAALRAQYEFVDLQHFLSLYFQGCQVLRTRQDFHDLTLAYLRRAAADGVVRAEMFFGPQSFLDLGVGVDVQFGGIFDAIDEASSEWGIDGALIVSAHRHRSQADALELFELVQPYSDRVAGFGLGSVELGNPPSKFADYFAAARGRGFATTIHAGEEGPASYVREALDVCRVDRIDHGVRAVEDPDLVSRLADLRVPLTVCPVSNLRLKVVSDIAELPIPQLLDAGVVVTLNSDDPSYFGGYVQDNYVAVERAFGLSGAAMADLARNSITASWATDERKVEWLDSVIG